MTTHTAASTPAEELDFLGARVRVLATGEQTGDSYGLLDMVEVAPGDMPPLHVHHRHDEGFLLISGELTLLMPEREVVLAPGQFVLAPRGIPHTYRVGDAPARWLVISTPSGFEAFVQEVAALAAPTPETLGAVAAGHGIEILGPPGMTP